MITRKEKFDIYDFIQNFILKTKMKFVSGNRFSILSLKMHI